MTSSDEALRLLREAQHIDQSVVGPMGNCQSACLAMLLVLPLVDVPNFLDLPGADKDDEVSFRAQQAWLYERGWGLVTIQARGPSFKRHFSKGYILVGGKSPCGLQHAVIYKDGELWHDPHPERGGLSEIEEVDILYLLAPFALLSAGAGEQDNAVGQANSDESVAGGGAPSSPAPAAPSDAPTPRPTRVSVRDILPYVHSLEEYADNLTRYCEALQAKLDELMLEYCPHEMTPQQRRAWEAAQSLASAKG